MGRSDGQPQRRTGGIRRDEPNPVTFADTSDRGAKMTQDDNEYEQDDSTGPPRTNSSVIRRTNLTVPRTTTQHSSPVPPRRTMQPPRSSTTTSIPAAINIQQQFPRNNTRPQATKGAPRKNVLKGKVHWLLPVGIGMIAMLVLWELGSIALVWGTARYDDIRYGNPRTYQTDAVVGHGKDSTLHPSHFIAVNLNRQAIVVEFPAGNPAGAESYVVPYYILGPGADQVPVTLEFRDVTGDGKLDMIIHIHLQSQDQTFVFINDGTKFRAPTSKDNIHM